MILCLPRIYTKEHSIIMSQRLAPQQVSNLFDYEGGNGMNALWAWFAALIYEYGIFGASMPSVHGGFEASVPSSLQTIASERNSKAATIKKQQTR